jgi:hypothetical protein
VPSPEEVAALAEASVVQESTDHAHRVIEQNLERAQLMLTSGLAEVDPSVLHDGDPPFVESDRRQFREAAATVAFNANRSSTMYRLGTVLREHEDAARAIASFRANNYAVIMLTVVAGAATSATLASTATARAGTAMIVGGALSLIGLSIADSTTRLTRGHLTVGVVVGVIAGVGLGLLSNARLVSAIGLGLAGGVVSILWTMAQAHFGSGRLGRYLADWLRAPLR